MIKNIIKNLNYKYKLNIADSQSKNSTKKLNVRKSVRYIIHKKLG